MGFNFVWNTIRPCDMVTAGCFSAAEAYEHRISLAAIERRFPGDWEAGAVRIKIRLHLESDKTDTDCGWKTRQFLYKKSGLFKMMLI